MADDFSLELPDEDEIKEEVALALRPSQKTQEAIENTADTRASQIMDVDLSSVESRRSIVNAVESLGKDSVEKSNKTNEFLARRLATLSAAGGESSEVAKGLQELSIQMRDLDPSGIDFAKSGPLGKMFNPVRRYFERYKRADSEIAEIVKTLDRGKTTLKHDNTTLELEEGQMRETTKKLTQNIEMAMQLDEDLTRSLDVYRAEHGDDERVSFVENEVLFPLRQKIMDFQQLLVVNQQGIVAMDVIRRNNLELVRAVDRAEFVTVAALRVAVTVAGALYDQQIVLKKVQALNATTNEMISSTARMLHDQGLTIQQQAVEANISADTLKQSFADTLQALEDIETYRKQALPQMRRTIEEFREIADAGEKKLQQMEEAGAFDGIDNK